MLGQTKEIEVKAFSMKTNGILDTNEEWHNYPKDTDVPENLLKKMKSLTKGSTIELILDLDGSYRDFFILDMQAKSENKSGSDKYDEEFVSFKDLLKQAHIKFGGSLSIITEMLNVSMEQPIFKATVTISSKKPGSAMVERVFTGHGDADKTNTTKMTSMHLVRLAETRAIARALRFALGDVRCSEEELQTVKPVVVEDVGE